MSHHRITPNVQDPSDQLGAALAALRTELELPGGYPADAVGEARKAVESRALPDRDLRDVPFVTIDPATSTDLDQAVHIERAGQGYKVLYAIADVPAFVVPGGALDAETRRRGQTFYAPDSRIPLHPEIISENAGSLLPEQDCGAFVWDFALDGAGEVQTVSVARATVRSRAKLSYKGAQQQIDDGNAPPVLALLKEVGLKRVELERLRGGASLNMPEQEIVQSTDGGGHRIEAAPSLPVEDWNAQISLMTGMAAASMMLEGKVGILRTMPAPDENSLRHFKRQTVALGKPWDGKVTYGEYLRTLDAADPKQLAILHSAGTLFRGAGYTPFDGEVPEVVIQAAIGAPYAHTTAPLRRLIDRFVLVICEALCNKREIPAWAREALPTLPGIMAASDQLAGRLERAALDTVEAALLANHVGEKFTAVVISGSKPTNGNGNGNGGPYGTIQIAEPAVTARCNGTMESGTEVRVRLATADIASREILFDLVP